MRVSSSIDKNILIASDNPGDAAFIKKLLEAEFPRIFISTDPSLDVSDFDHLMPDVLVLAFKNLEKSERHCLGLYRRSKNMHSHAHRTVVLCDKDEIQRAYKLCREDIFDDYVLFWPMTTDAPRLPMAIHHALRDLAAHGLPSVAEFATQVKRLSALEDELTQQLSLAEEHVASIRHAVVKANSGATAAFDRVSHRLVVKAQSNADKTSGDMQKKIESLKNETVESIFNSLTDSVQPLQKWSDEVRNVTAPHLESIHALNTLASKIQPVLLVVDDDESQRKLLDTILKSTRYQVQLAHSGVEALGLLRKIRPELILMDVMMPGMSGVEVVEHIKAIKPLAGIPILMVTGKSDKDVVKASLIAGACDFVVKPFSRDTLLEKISHALKNH